MKVEDLMKMLKKADPQDEVRFYTLKLVEAGDLGGCWMEEQLFIEDCSKSENDLKIILG
jgi:hypothetical protein